MATEIESAFIHDVVIVGAGPCGLAVAARLRESNPSPLFTKVEYERYDWIRRHGEKTRILNTKGRAQKMVIENTSNCRECRPVCKVPYYKIQVFDSTGGAWLGKWKGLFRALEIKALRSPMFFHPDPLDRDGLKAYCFKAGRTKEMFQLKGVCGKEISKHRLKQVRMGANGKRLVDNRDSQDYFTPSTRLFEDYCEQCVDRYSLQSTVQKSAIESIKFDEVGEGIRPNRCFTIQTSEGVQYSRTVVLAIGGGSPPPLPIQPHESEGACHSSQLLKQDVIRPHMQHKITNGKPLNVVVIGGGLTSAQITDLCIRKGVSKVWHIMRSDFKTKYFDLDLDWVGKYKNHNMSTFWSADDDEERFEMIRAARNGGSITPAYKTILQGHERSKKLFIHTKTTIVRKNWDPVDKLWNIATEPPIPNLPPVDFIYYATGSTANISALPMLDSIKKSYPIPTVNGLPCLTNDLQWNEEVPLFMTGRFAGLRLGPGAANLEGARMGAERIAWRLEEILKEGEEVA